MARGWRARVFGGAGAHRAPARAKGAKSGTNHGAGQGQAAPPAAGVEPVPLGLHDPVVAADGVRCQACGKGADRPHATMFLKSPCRPPGVSGPLPRWRWDEVRHLLDEHGEASCLRCHGWVPPSRRDVFEAARCPVWRVVRVGDVGQRDWGSGWRCGSPDLELVLQLARASRAPSAPVGALRAPRPQVRRNRPLRGEASWFGRLIGSSLFLGALPAFAAGAPRSEWRPCRPIPVGVGLLCYRLS